MKYQIKAICNSSHLKKYNILMLSFLLLMFAGCKDKEGGMVLLIDDPNYHQSTQKLTITPRNLSLAVGLTKQMKAEKLLNDNSIIDVTNDANLSWSSYDSNVIEISTTGYITAINSGSTTIAASYTVNDISFNDSVDIIVTEAIIDTLQVTPTTASIAAGTTKQYTALAHFTDESVEDITAHPLLSWSSSAPDIATIDNATGIVTGVDAGVVNITASGTVNGKTFTKTVPLTVTNAVLDRLQVTPTTASIAAGTTKQYTALAHFTDESVEDITAHPLLSWSSSALDIATVDNATGIVTGVDAGVVNITASGTVNGKTFTKTVSLTVTNAVLDRLQVTPATASIAARTTKQYTALAHFTDDSVEDITTYPLLSWSSSDPDIATIDNATGIVTGVDAGVVNITASGTVNGKTFTKTVPLTVTNAVLDRLQVTPTTASIAAGATKQYTALAHFTDESVEDITAHPLLSWSSSAPDIATVDNATGIVTGVDVGVVNITASGTVNGRTFTKTVPLTVTDAILDRLQVTPTTASIAAGTMKQYTALAHFTDDSVEDITAHPLLSWSSSAPDIATVDNATGIVTGVDAGVVNITASSTVNGKTFTKTVPLTVTDAILDRLQVTPTTVSIAAGATKQYTALAHFTDDSVEDITAHPLLSWSSSAPDIATVDNATGIVTGVDAGVVNITASGTVNGKTFTKTVPLTVTDAVLDRLQVTPTTASIAAGTTKQYTALAHFTDDSVEDITAHPLLSWSSSAPDIATVDNATGIVTGVDVGVVNITASSTVNGRKFTKTVPLTVTDAILDRLQVTPTTASIAAGATKQYTALAHFTDDSVEDITAHPQVFWSSSDPDIATIDNGTAIATGVETGTTTITALVHINNRTLKQEVYLTVTDAVVSSLQVTPAKSSIAAGLSQPYTAFVHLTDDSVEDVTVHPLLFWSSNNPEVVTIDNATGIATTIKTGTAIITASGTTNGRSFKQTAELTVTDAIANELKLTPLEASIAAGQTQKYLARVLFSDNSIVDVTKNPAVFWSSKDDDIATIDNGTALAVGENVGFVEIVASGKIYNEPLKESASLTVTDAIVESLQVTPSTATVPLGLNQQYLAKAHMTDRRVIDVTNHSDLSWSSSNVNVATIDNATGVVTTTGIGTATITALGIVDSRKFKQIAEIEVTDAVVTNLEITPMLPSIAAGLTQQFNATAYFSDDSELDVTTASALSWHSSNNNVVTIDNTTGIATGVRVGSAIITASGKANGQLFTKSTEITITDAIEERLEIRSSLVVPLLLSTEFSVKVIYTDGSTNDVTNVSNVIAKTGNLKIEDIKTIRGMAYGEGTFVATYNKLTVEKKMSVTNGICGSEPDQPIGVQLGGGINDARDNAKGESCLKVGLHNGLYFTAPPSEEFVRSMGDYYVHNSKNNSGSSVAFFYSPPEHKEQRFANFRSDGLNVTYPDFTNSQSDRWCQNLSRAKFGGIDTWRTPTREELKKAIDGRHLGNLYHWPSGHNWTTTTCSTNNISKGYWGVNNRGRNPVESCFEFTRHTYSSCVAEE